MKIKVEEIKRRVGDVDDTLNAVSILLNKIKPVQDKLNKEMTGNVNYAKELVTAKGKTINYGTCLISELNEMQDSTPWKHWKHSDGINLDNMKLEIVDIFHFSPSICLTIDELDDSIDTTNVNLYPEQYESWARENPMIPNIDGDEMNLIDYVQLIINHTIVNAACISSTYILNTIYNDNYITADILKKINDEIMVSVFMIYKVLFNKTNEEAINDMWSVYVVKNTLNLFRMSNGYNDGTYIKIWDGKEDNEVAMSIMAINPMLSAGELYIELEKVYGTINK